MERVLIIVSSPTGFTRRYADWIAEEVGADVVPLEEAAPEMLAPYALVICGSPIYGGEYHCLKKFQSLQRRSGKWFLYYATGICPQSQRTVRRIARNNFPVGQQAYYFEGGLDREKLAPSQRALLTCYQAMLRRQGNTHPEDAVVLDRMRVSGDYTRREAIQPLVRRVLDGLLEENAGTQTEHGSWPNEESETIRRKLG